MLSAEIDPLVQEKGHLNGLLLIVPHFPGWEDFDALFAHLSFVRHHHKQVEKVAVVSSERLFSLLVKEVSGNHFFHPEIRVFSDEGEAKQWLSFSL